MATQLDALKMYGQGLSIKVRACRVWIASNNGQATTFNCVFVDENACTKAKDIQHFATLIKEGEFYEVKKFYTYENKLCTYENRFANAVVGHEAMIDLKQDVEVLLIEKNKPVISRHLFNIIDFSSLLTIGRESKTLIDVVGRLKGVELAETITVQGYRQETKREIIIDNIRGQKLRVTLWGDVAKRFDEQAVLAMDPPVLVLFAGFRAGEFLGEPVLNGTAASVWYFSPDITEILSLRHYFTSIPSEVQLLPARAGIGGTPEQQKKQNRRTIKELLCMNPHDFRGQKFTCRASITDYDLHWGWWYRSCPRCNKLVRPEGQEGSRLKCPTHEYLDRAPVPWFKVDCIVTDGNDVTNFMLIGEAAEKFFGGSAHYYVVQKGFSDPYKIPPPMAEKLMKYSIFQITFGMFRSSNNRCDMMITNVFSDDSDNEIAQPQLLEVAPDEALIIDTTTAKASSSNHVQVILEPNTPAIKESVVSTASASQLSKLQHDMPHPTTLQPQIASHVVSVLTDTKRRLDFLTEPSTKDCSSQETSSGVPQVTQENTAAMPTLSPPASDDEIPLSAFKKKKTSFATSQ